MSSPISLKLDWCDISAARFAVKHWHYSERLPDPKSVKIGVWEAEAFKGCLIFSLGVASSNLSKTLGLTTTQICELTRVAMTRHVTPVSRIIRIALGMLRRQCPGLKLIISYADPNHKHHGGIYQAGNWIYTGLSSATPVWVDAQGREYHDRSVSKTGLKKQFGAIKRVRSTSDLRRVKRLPKYRYFMALDDDMKRRIAPLAQPYPKRVASDTIDTAVVQTDKGGETPTATLQNKAVK